MGRMRVTDTVAEQARKGWDRRDFLGGAALLAMALSWFASVRSRRPAVA